MVAADPRIVRRGRAATAAPAVVWVVHRANAVFEDGAYPDVPVKELATHFGVAESSLSTRGATVLQAIGVDLQGRVGQLTVGTPRYLTGRRRAEILQQRERLRS